MTKDRNKLSELTLNAILTISVYADGEMQKVNISKELLNMTRTTHKSCLSYIEQEIEKENQRKQAE